MYPFGIGFSITTSHKSFHRKRRIYEFIVDETLIKVGNELVWVWIAIELKDKTILGIRISYVERSMLIAEYKVIL